MELSVAPSVLHFIPCDGALPDPHNILRYNVYGLTTTLHSDADPPFPFRRRHQKLLVVFRGGRGVGEFVIRVVHDESGQIVTRSATPHRVRFVGGEQEVTGAMVAVRDCMFRHQGVYWFELVFLGNVIARQPIRVLP